MIEKLLEEIKAEQAKQKKNHPLPPKYLLNPGFEPTVGMIETALEWRRKDNDMLEDKGEHSWFGILGEEYREMFTAKTKEERRAEGVQVIALVCRMLESEE